MIKVENLTGEKLVSFGGKVLGSVYPEDGAFHLEIGNFQQRLVVYVEDMIPMAVKNCLIMQVNEARLTYSLEFPNDDTKNEIALDFCGYTSTGHIENLGSRYKVEFVEGFLAGCGARIVVESGGRDAFERSMKHWLRSTFSYVGVEYAGRGD